MLERDTMEENKESLIYNYVCPRCFNQIDRCNCDSKPYYSLWWVDLNIQEAIRILNEKGYKTQYSCESHKPHDNMYIAFLYTYGFGKDLPAPDGFKCNGGGKIIEHLYGKDSKARKKMSEEEFEAEKRKHLEILLEWAKSLPEQTGEIKTWK